jgi:hypothetical protein
MRTGPGAFDEQTRGSIFLLPIVRLDDGAVGPPLQGRQPCVPRRIFSRHGSVIGYRGRIWRPVNAEILREQSADAVRVFLVIADVQMVHADELFGRPGFHHLLGQSNHVVVLSHEGANVFAPGGEPRSSEPAARKRMK